MKHDLQSVRQLMRETFSGAPERSPTPTHPPDAERGEPLPAFTITGSDARFVIIQINAQTVTLEADALRGVLAWPQSSTEGG